MILLANGARARRERRHRVGARNVRWLLISHAFAGIELARGLSEGIASISVQLFYCGRLFRALTRSAMIRPLEARQGPQCVCVNELLHGLIYTYELITFFYIWSPIEVISLPWHSFSFASV